MSASREFDCIECGRHVVSFGAHTGEEHGFCAACLMAPGWFDAIERQQVKEAR